MISKATNLLLKAADACRRRVDDPVILSQIVYLFLLRDLGPETVPHLAELSGAPTSTVDKALRALASHGFTRSSPSLCRRTPTTWHLTPLGSGFLAGIDCP